MTRPDRRAAPAPRPLPFGAWYAAHRDPVDAVADADADLRAELAGLAQDAVGMAGVLVPAVWLLPPIADTAAAGIAGYVALDRLARLVTAGRVVRRRRVALADHRAGATYAPAAATTLPGTRGAIA